MSDFKFKCPHCQQSLEAPEEMLGAAIDCPSCNGQIQLPATQPQPDAEFAPTPAKQQHTGDVIASPPSAADAAGDSSPCSGQKATSDRGSHSFACYLPNLPLGGIMTLNLLQGKWHRGNAELTEASLKFVAEVKIGSSGEISIPLDQISRMTFIRITTGQQFFSLLKSYFITACGLTLVMGIILHAKGVSMLFSLLFSFVFCLCIALFLSLIPNLFRLKRDFYDWILLDKEMNPLPVDVRVDAEQKKRLEAGFYDLIQEGVSVENIAVPHDKDPGTGKRKMILSVLVLIGCALAFCVADVIAGNPINILKAFVIIAIAMAVGIVMGNTSQNKEQKETESAAKKGEK
ncbi:MAG: hypothetical protein WCS27_13030 [Victivallaceae bacterium]